MCCRYHVEEYLYDEVDKIPGLQHGVVRHITGDIHPTDTAPVIVKAFGEDTMSIEEPGEGNMSVEEPGSIFRNADLFSKKNGNSLILSDMAWGFKAFDEGNLLINARAESLLRKPAFRGLAKENRCVIPTTSFYEWDNTRDKVTFTHLEQPVMYFAGCFKILPDGAHYVIITTAANDSMTPVHDRMPLILEKDMIPAWILNSGKTGDILKMASPKLSLYRPYEQLSFL